MKKTVKTRIRNRELAPFTKRELLLNGIPGLFFPCSFESDYSAIFYTDGYVNINAAGVLSSCDILDVLGLLFHKMDEAENFLFERGSYLVSCDTVFIRYGEKRISDVKMIYAADEYGRCDNIKELCLCMKSFTDVEGEAYLDNICSFIDSSNPTYAMLLKNIEQAKQEIHIFEKY